LIEVPLDEEDWEQGVPDDLFDLLKYADESAAARFCSALSAT
jgi:hypothetical protein